MKRLIINLVIALAAAFVFATDATAQTVIDLHSGRVSGKTREDYNVKTREDWQLREDSIAYNDCVTRAFNYLYEDSLQTAQNLFERALKLRPQAPENAVVRHNIGRIYMARRQWKDATTLFSQVLNDYPQFDDMREDRASCYIELSQHEQALKDYEQLVMRHPDDAHYLLLRALMLSYTGRKYDAIDELDALIEADSENADYYLVRATIYAEIGNKGYARRDLDRAVALGIPKDDILDLYEQLK